MLFFFLFLIFAFFVGGALSSTSPKPLSSVFRTRVAQIATGFACAPVFVASTNSIISKKKKCSSSCKGGEACSCGVVSSVAAADSLYYNPRNERIYDTRRRSYLPAHPEDFLIKELENKKVVIVGEVHSNPCHHHVEFEVVKALKPDAIGLECFYRQHQLALDRFIFVHGDMGILKAETAWQQTWGFDLNFYAKLFNYAAKNKIRLVGLNVPYDVARLVGQSGLASLPLSLVDLLPEMDLSVEKHKQAFLSAIGGDTSHGGSMQHFYEAQVLWDEYMAESASKYMTKYPENTLLVIAGVGHIKGRVGMPDRVQKRTGQVPFVIVPQQIKWDDEVGLPDVAVPPGPDEAEWIWYTEPAIA